ncbi:hypothetical protein ACFE04_021065 [Oxalis oulophora]
MGCVHSVNLLSPNNNQRLMYVNNNANNNNNNKVVDKQGDKKVVLKNKNIDLDFVVVNAWPKWLVDNIPGDVLAALVPKSADSYDKLAKIGQGTYSNVYKARDRETGKIVALKKVRFDTSEPQSVKFMAREIMILQKLDHPNVIKLRGVATSRMHYSLYLVFDFMQSDLTKIICQGLNEPQVKCYMQQLLYGLQHCHERGILHRDLKSSNLLIDKKGVLKIADFGLANVFIPKPKLPLTSRVVTLWYRAPELLLGSTDYDVGIDLWSVGCLLAEMFTGKPIMPGRTEVEQLHRIFKLCGSPSDDYWKKMKLPASFRPPQYYKPTFQETFKDLPSTSFDLLTSLLSLDPANRGTAAFALTSLFFNSGPLACGLSGLPVINKDKNSTQSTERVKYASFLLVYSFVIESIKGKVANRFPFSRHKKKKPSQGRGKRNLATEYVKSDAKSLKDLGKRAVRSPHGQAEMMTRVSISSVVGRGWQKTMGIGGTEAHPNASKNIQNYTLLQASISDIINSKDNLPLYRRSVSTLDFRALDPDKISKLLGLENH